MSPLLGLFGIFDENFTNEEGLHTHNSTVFLLEGLDRYENTVLLSCCHTSIMVIDDGCIECIDYIFHLINKSPVLVILF